jgi:predicted kinase
MEPTPLIIILGPPATGKTTLGRRLAADLRLPFLGRDDFKERLFDRLGWRDREWSRQLGMASWDLLWHAVECQLAAGKAAIAESNFNGPIATARVRELAARYDFAPVQINCVTAGAVLVERHRRRAESGERHPGHVDTLESVRAELRDTLLRGRYEPLAIGGRTIELDTTDFAAVDYDALLATLREELPACREAEHH